jgi:hypothetical protein
MRGGSIEPGIFGPQGALSEGGPNAHLLDTAGRRRSPATLPGFRLAHAVELAHEGVPFMVIRAQRGHSNLGITSVYLQGIDDAEIIETVHAGPAPKAWRVGGPLRPEGGSAMRGSAGRDRQ